MLMASVVGGLAEGDAAAGKAIFNRCKACHDAVGEANKVGPNLNGIVDRPVAALESFKRYSPAMKEAGAAGMIWNTDTLAEYLRAPKAKVPGTNMAFAGIKKDDEMANLIAYLKADPKP